MTERNQPGERPIQWDDVAVDDLGNHIGRLIKIGPGDQLYEVLDVGPILDDGGRWVTVPAGPGQTETTELRVHGTVRVRDTPTSPAARKYLIIRSYHVTPLAQATPTLADVEAALAWLRARFDEEWLTAGDNLFRVAEVETARKILSWHEPVETDEHEAARTRDGVLVKCQGEYSDREQAVKSPCAHVLAIAYPYSGRHDFPTVLRAPD